MAILLLRPWIIIWILLLSAAAFLFWKYVWPKSDINDDGKVDFKDLKVNVLNVTDVNKDGKVDTADAVESVQKVAAKATAVVKKTADVNKDGKVNKTDAKAAASKVKAAVKKTTTKKTSK